MYPNSWVNHPRQLFYRHIPQQLGHHLNSCSIGMYPNSWVNHPRQLFYRHVSQQLGQSPSSAVLSSCNLTAGSITLVSCSIVM
ncbi:hypothetical protein RRG08_029528 [Elysia crispata]|uniref:Uncharacterized protein n=1 Tax=Elysia crispata TaxID=231223 RepID=A0AAE0XX83_9GAST|nr:hypothetical protein RRG08_029528 [Elysia crispata]